MPKHMTLSERIFIEKSVSQGMPFSEIGRKLNRAATTISREVKNRRAFTERWTGKTENDCIYYPMCVIQNLCGKKCNCYYRDRDAKEIDVVIEGDGKLCPLEKRQLHRISEFQKTFKLIDKSPLRVGTSAVL